MVKQAKKVENPTKDVVTAEVVQNTPVIVTAPPTEQAVTKITVSTTTRLKDSPESTSSVDEIIEVHKFATTPATVHVNIPLKLSMNFQSLGIEVGVTRPCYTEELDKAFTLAYEMAFAKIQQKIPEIQNTLMGISSVLKK